MNKAGRRGGTMGHSAARKSFKRLGKNCWFDVPKGYFTACFLHPTLIYSVVSKMM